MQRNSLWQKVEFYISVYESGIFHCKYVECLSNNKTAQYSAGVFIILRATGISILCWNVYNVFMLQIFFSRLFFSYCRCHLRVQIAGCKLHCSVIRHKYSHYSLDIWRTLQKQFLWALEIEIQIPVKAHTAGACVWQSHKVTFFPKDHFVSPHLSFISIPQRDREKDGSEEDREEDKNKNRLT